MFPTIHNFYVQQNKDNTALHYGEYKKKWVTNYFVHYFSWHVVNANLTATWQSQKFTTTAHLKRKRRVLTPKPRFQLLNKRSAFLFFFHMLILFGVLTILTSASYSLFLINAIVLLKN